MENKELQITPRTKVFQLIETYPHLEEVLIQYVPAFKKLKNPVLRNTVAKISTLQQAAAVGNINIADLINKLRNEVGQDSLEEAENKQYSVSKPAWFSEDKVHHEFDVREMLSRGDHPVAQVIADLQQMPDGKIYKMIAPFLPAPLIDKAASLQFQHWVLKENEELFNVYFIKQ